MTKTTPTLEKQFKDLRNDLNQKHEENRESLGLEARLTKVETQLTSIVGDNSGGSGLLHEIRDDVKALQGEVSSIKQTVQDTPAINKWVYGAIAVIGFLVVAVPIVVVIVFEILKLASKH